MAGTYPAILKDELVGDESQKLFDDALAMIDELIKKDIIELNAVAAFYSATESDNTVSLSIDGEPLGQFHFLRQQMKKREENPNYQDWIIYTE